MIGEIALAIEMGADAVDIGKTIHPHPTLGEIDRHGGGGLRGRLHGPAAAPGAGRPIARRAAARRCRRSAGRNGRARRSAKKSSAFASTVRKAISSHGTSSSRNRRASIVSGPGVEVGVEQARAVEQVHLADAHHVEQREQALQLDARAGFLDRSRAARPASVVSPSSMKPAGSVHKP